MTPRQIEFDLIGNAIDSLTRAVELLAFEDVRFAQARLKHAIANAAHAIELLLKERLRRVSPALLSVRGRLSAGQGAARL
jgi:hypothetical protein